MTVILIQLRISKQYVRCYSSNDLNENSISLAYYDFFHNRKYPSNKCFFTFFLIMASIQDEITHQK